MRSVADMLNRIRQQIQMCPTRVAHMDQKPQHQAHNTKGVQWAVTKAQVGDGKTHMGEKEDLGQKQGNLINKSGMGSMGESTCHRSSNNFAER